MSGAIFSRIAFYPTLFYNILMSKVTSREWYNRIDDNVILGALPLKSWNKTLVEKENVRGIVSLTEDFETKGLVNTQEEWAAVGVEQIKLSTVDYVGTPSQEQINEALTFIDRHQRQENSVYVHCKAGRTRSATVVACYLIQKHGYSPMEAVDFIRAKRPHIWLREAQLESLQEFHKHSRVRKSFTGA
ncbi:hypothetical protein FSP39_013587 [Pinctada imbricata]|uniref:Phosphatidylglycerophosphatase and protein-tyrosine phosphatase 1 n=1 Tax=Pinctada imbricata TaxID=66713 RepID=A0AA88YKJ3_PINIB|nr:hypothetical protein FSP39_013587 [Pinctada imbricata]